MRKWKWLVENIREVKRLLLVQYHYGILKLKTGHQQIGLKIEEETSEVLRLEHGSVWC